MKRKIAMLGVTVVLSLGGSVGTASMAVADSCTISISNCDSSGRCFVNSPTGTCRGNCYINGPLAYCGQYCYTTVNLGYCY